MAHTANTAWGTTTVVEEVTIKQSASGKTFQTLVQLLEAEDGDTFVRFAYSTGDTARRGPVTLRRADLDKLKKALAKAPRLAKELFP
jgi:hypothetical protein